MKYFKDFQDKIISEIKKNRCLIFFDYDGTLTPIVNKPEEAILDDKTREVLRKLSFCTNIYLGIISGREIKDIKNKIKLRRIYYAGNHGLQIEGPGIKFVHPQALKFRHFLQKIKVSLINELSSIEGVGIEDKRYTLSIHYRNVNPSDLREFRKIVNNLLSGLKKENKIKIKSGKKVIEVHPPLNWDKGKCVQLLRNIINPNYPCFYVGDDVTDESVFKILKKKDCSVVIGKKKSCAQYFFNSSKEFISFLNDMVGGNL